MNRLDRCAAHLGATGFPTANDAGQGALEPRAQILCVATVRALLHQLAACGPHCHGQRLAYRGPLLPSPRMAWPSLRREAIKEFDTPTIFNAVSRVMRDLTPQKWYTDRASARQPVTPLLPAWPGSEGVQG